MATKAKPKMPDKKIVKKMLAPKKETKKKQRYVRLDRVETMKLDGWKKVVEVKDKHDRTLGIKTGGQSDLVLMEK